MTRIVEQVQAGPGARVDREAGIIAGVRILGPVSGNGRKYTAAAIRGAKALYEGARVNFDHARGATERTVEDRAGWLTDVREQAGGLHADLHLLLSDRRSRKILEAADKRPELFGLSHDVDVRTSSDGRTVEEIGRVHSVDIVTDPATTRSLYESTDPPPAPTPKPRPLSPAAQRAARRLAEDFGRALDQRLAGLADEIAVARRVPRSTSEFAAMARGGRVAEQTSETVTSDAPDTLARPGGGNHRDGEPIAAEWVRRQYADAVAAVVDDDGLSVDEAVARVKALLRARERAIASAVDPASEIARILQGAPSDVAHESWGGRHSRPVPISRDERAAYRHAARRLCERQDLTTDERAGRIGMLLLSRSRGVASETGIRIAESVGLRPVVPQTASDFAAAVRRPAGVAATSEPARTTEGTDRRPASVPHTTDEFLSRIRRG